MKPLVMMVSYCFFRSSQYGRNRLRSMMAGATHNASALMMRIAPRISIDAGVLSKFMGSARLGESAVFEPLREALRPPLDAHVLRSLAHVERMFALRVD